MGSKPLLCCAGMIVLHPDLLLSGTRISGSFRCQRQSVLEERFAGSSNDKAVEGTLMHEVFQVWIDWLASLCCCQHWCKGAGCCSDTIAEGHCIPQHPLYSLCTSPVGLLQSADKAALLKGQRKHKLPNTAQQCQPGEDNFVTHDLQKAHNLSLSGIYVYNLLLCNCIRYIL